MKVKEVTFYQSVRIPKANGYELHRAGAHVAETKDCEIVFHKGCVVMSHPNWTHDCIVGLANVRNLTMEKGEFLQDLAEKSVANDEAPKIDTEKKPRSAAPKK